MWGCDGLMLKLGLHFGQGLWPWSSGHPDVTKMHEKGEWERLYLL